MSLGLVMFLFIPFLVSVEDDAHLHRFNLLMASISGVAFRAVLCHFPSHPVRAPSSSAQEIKSASNALTASSLWSASMRLMSQRNFSLVAIAYSLLNGFRCAIFSHALKTAPNQVSPSTPTATFLCPSYRRYCNRLDFRNSCAHGLVLPLAAFRQLYRCSRLSLAILYGRVGLFSPFSASPSWRAPHLLPLCSNGCRSESRIERAACLLPRFPSSRLPLFAPIWPPLLRCRCCLRSRSSWHSVRCQKGAR